MSLDQIGAIVGVHGSTVSKWSADIARPIARRRVSFDIQEDIRELREVGYSATEIQREIQRSHGVSISTKTIYTHLKRMGLSDRIPKMQPDEARRFRKALRRHHARVRAVAKRFGVSEGYAKSTRSKMIARGGIRKSPRYSEETRARCVQIADRCGSSDRAARMIRAVAGAGPSGSSIRKWRSGRGL